MSSFETQLTGMSFGKATKFEQNAVQDTELAAFIWYMSARTGKDVKTSE